MSVVGNEKKTSTIGNTTEDIKFSEGGVDNEKKNSVEPAVLNGKAESDIILQEQQQRFADE